VKVIYLVPLVAMAVVGCGGNDEVSENRTRGAADVVITWPERTRLIPNASESIVITISAGDQELGRRVVARPVVGNTVRVAFQDLPATDLTLKAEAFPSDDGSGVAQASAAEIIRIVADQTTQASITMESTIVRIDIAPTNPTLAVGNAVNLTATAKNVGGQMVVIGANTTTWSSSNPAVATVDQNGQVIAIAEGTTTITFRESESNVSGQVTVTVVSDTETP
jgi:hypothetical protein